MHKDVHTNVTDVYKNTNTYCDVQSGSADNTITHLTILERKIASNEKNNGYINSLIFTFNVVIDCFFLQNYCTFTFPVQILSRGSSLETWQLLTSRCNCYLT